MGEERHICRARCPRPFSHELTGLPELRNNNISYLLILNTTLPVYYIQLQTLLYISTRYINISCLLDTSLL
jgi:hypothetical protein